MAESAAQAAEKSKTVVDVEDVVIRQNIQERAQEPGMDEEYTLPENALARPVGMQKITLADAESLKSLLGTEHLPRTTLNEKLVEDVRRAAEIGAK